MHRPNQRAEEVFAEAIRIADAVARRAYLNRGCAGNDALRQEVESLVQSHFAAGNFLEQPMALPQTEVLTERAGTRIGRYKLLEKIGEGGFGVVYMAEQVEPVQRKVALKIIKAGMDTHEVVARFEAERQALALMDHPNIARVFDAGATQAERPYFVMELVNGIPITDYCDREKLSTTERLQLFMKVCHAVQHAHQKGIIHRDLKPNNVLVTQHDGEPVPKVIDFGVAKALGQKLTEKTLFTAFRDMIGTPAYMSPEQAELSGLDIDTRADIYSLGVLLYELLTGETPFNAETLRKAALDEIRRMIRETEPPKPSTRLQTLGNRLTEVAKRRQTGPTALRRLVRGDLDWIVMKALEKDRRRRYETPDAFASDVARHLSNEPVLAVPPSLAYRFRRFAKRHRVALVTSVAFIALLAAGTVTSTWEAVRATQAERAQTLLREQAEAGENKALAEARKSQQVARFLEDMLQGVAPSVALGRDTTMLREIADRTAQRLGKDLADQPGVEADLCATVGNVYGDLGEYTNAAAMHRRALELRKKLFGAEHPDVASSLNDLAQALYGEGKWADAEATHRAALAMRRKLLGNDHVATAQSLNNLGEALRKQAEFVEAESLFREALAMRKRLLGDEHPAVAETLNNLGMLFNRQGNGKEAEPFLRDALRIRRKVRDEHPDVAQSLDQLAWALFYQGKYDEAEQTGREAVAMSRKLFGGAHPALAYSLHNLAFVLDRRGSLSEAEKLYREALAMQRELSNTENPDHMGTLILLGDTLFREGKNAEAETMFLEALAKRRNYFGDGHPALVSPLTCLARTVQRQGRPSEAEDFYRKALAIEAKETNSVGWTYMPLATLRSNLAQVLQEQGKFVEAKALTDEDAKTQTLAK